MKRTDVIWKDRKRNWLGLPWSFTVYTLVKDRLFVERGFLNSREDEIRLYRITDLTLTRNLWQKIVGTGTVHCVSADKSMRNFDLVNIRDSHEVKETLSELIDEARKANRVYARENMSVTNDDDDEQGFREGDPTPEDIAENH